MVLAYSKNTIGICPNNIITSLYLNRTIVSFKTSSVLSTNNTSFLNSQSIMHSLTPLP